MPNRTDSSEMETNIAVFTPQRRFIGTERKGLRRSCERQQELHDTDELDFPYDPDEFDVLDDPDELEFVINSGPQRTSQLFRHWGINE